MTFTRSALVLAGALLATMTAMAPRALACKCVLPSPEMAKEQASAVFEGRVTAMTKEPPSAEGGTGHNVVTLALVRTWKGLENEEVVEVRTRESSASCGIMFEKDTSYLVYAAQGEKGLEAGSCSRTRPMADAGEDLAALGGGVTPVKVSAKPAHTPAEKAPAEKPPAVRSFGCGSTSASGHATASLWFGLPVLATFARSRRRR